MKQDPSPRAHSAARPAKPLEACAHVSLSFAALASPVREGQIQVVRKISARAKKPLRVLLRVLVADPVGAVNEGLTALLSDLEGVSIFGCAQSQAKNLVP